MADETKPAGAFASVAVSISGRLAAADLHSSLEGLVKSGASAAVRLRGNVASLMSALVRLKERGGNVSATVFLRGDKKQG